MEQEPAGERGYIALAAQVGVHAFVVGQESFPFQGAIEVAADDQCFGVDLAPFLVLHGRDADHGRQRLEDYQPVFLARALQRVMAEGGVQLVGVAGRVCAVLVEQVELIDGFELPRVPSYPRNVMNRNRDRYVKRGMLS